MLSEWQIVLLDNGLWLLPLMCVVALAVFPWKHWNGLLIKHEQRAYQRRGSSRVDHDRAARSRAGGRYL
jgi:hypothetical protein